MGFAIFEFLRSFWSRFYDWECTGIFATLWWPTEGRSFKRGNGRIDDCTVEAQIVLAKLPQRGGGGFQRPCHLATFVGHSILYSFTSMHPKNLPEPSSSIEGRRGMRWKANEADNDHHCSSPSSWCMRDDMYSNTFIYYQIQYRVLLPYVQYPIIPILCQM